MKNMPRFIFGLATLAFGGSALAQPTAYPKAGVYYTKITNNTKSEVLGDTDKGDFYYVLPPTNGTAKATSGLKSGNGNLTFCSSLATTSASVNNLETQIAQLNSQVPDLKKSIDAKQARANDLAEQAAKLTVGSETLTNLALIEQKIKDDTAELNTLDDKYNACTADAVCTQLESQISALRKDLASLKSQSAQIRASAVVDTQKYEDALALADKAKLEVRQDQQTMNDLIAQMQTYSNEEFTSYKKYGDLDGGYRDILYDSGWDDAVQTLKVDNQNLNVTFAKIPIYNNQINLTLTGNDSQDAYEGHLSPVLSYNINGISYLPWTAPDGQKTQGLPDKFSANIRLNLVGACPIAYPEKFPQFKQDAYASSEVFQYPVAFHADVNVTYNAYKIYDIMRTQYKSGNGSFDSSAVNSLLNNEDFNANLKVTIKSEDPNPDTRPDLNELRKEASGDILQKILAQMAIPKDGTPSTTLPDLPTPPEHGALVAAENNVGVLTHWDCELWWGMCVHPSYFWKIYDAERGTSKAEASYKAHFDQNISEDWSFENGELRWSTISFISK